MLLAGVHVDRSSAIDGWECRLCRVFLFEPLAKRAETNKQKQSPERPVQALLVLHLLLSSLLSPFLAAPLIDSYRRHLVESTSYCTYLPHVWPRQEATLPHEGRNAHRFNKSIVRNMIFTHPKKEKISARAYTDCAQHTQQKDADAERPLAAENGMCRSAASVSEGATAAAVAIAPCFPFPFPLVFFFLGKRS